jgi:hypothetical protein
MPEDPKANKTGRSNGPTRANRLRDDADGALDTTAEQRLAMMWEFAVLCSSKKGN